VPPPRPDSPGTDRPEQDGAEYERPTISPRRLFRWAAVISSFVVAVLVCWQDPGYAHDDDPLGTIAHHGRSVGINPPG